MKRLLFICALVYARAAQAQTPVALAPVPRPVFTQNGAPLVNGCLFSFAAGTSTPLATFTDSTGSVQNANPTILDANGTPSSGGNEVGIYLSSANYKFQLKAFGGTNCASGASVWTADNINAASFLNLPNTWTQTQTFNAPGAQDINAGNTNGILWAGSTKYPTAQAALTACPATDCWVIALPGSQSVPTNISRSHLHLSCFTQGVPAATITAASNLQWGTAPADNKCIFTSAVNVVFSGVWDTTIEGITFDFGSNNAGIVLQNGVFETHLGTPAGKVVIQNSGTGTALTLSAGAAVGQAINSNDFDVSIYNVGKGIVFTAPSATTNAANNKFHVTHINNVSTRAIEFVQWADSNRFESTFISGLANAADGIAFNTGSPAANVGVFGNVFEHCLCADATNPGSYTGKLVTVNKAEHPNAILDWEIGPGITSGGGTILSNPTAYPFDAHVTTDITDGNDAVFIGIVGIRDRTNTVPMGVSKKQGSNAGNYTSTSLTFAAVDGTNLTNTLTVPLGWKLEVKATGTVANSTAAAGMAVAIYDGTCGSGTLLQAQHQGATVTADWRGFSMLGLVTGDAAAHTINLCHLTLNAADAVNMENTGGFYPVMTFTLIPST